MCCDISVCEESFQSRSPARAGDTHTHTSGTHSKATSYYTYGYVTQQCICNAYYTAMHTYYTYVRCSQCANALGAHPKLATSHSLSRKRLALPEKCAHIRPTSRLPCNSSTATSHGAPAQLLAGRCVTRISRDRVSKAYWLSPESTANGQEGGGEQEGTMHAGG